MAFFKINGISVKTPMTCAWSLADLSSEDSGRTLDGLMHKDVVAQKRTLKVKWGSMSWVEAALITQYCKKKGVKVQVTYPDVMEGQMITKDFYTGDCSAPYYFWLPVDQRIESVSCDFIEF